MIAVEHLSDLSRTFLRDRLVKNAVMRPIPVNRSMHVDQQTRGDHSMRVAHGLHLGPRYNSLALAKVKQKSRKKALKMLG